MDSVAVGALCIHTDTHARVGKGGGASQVEKEKEALKNNSRACNMSPGVWET